jgi:hypothetical protein
VSVGQWPPCAPSPQPSPRGRGSVTRLARGLPSGSQLEYANAAVLADAIQGRQAMG